MNIHDDTFQRMRAARHRPLSDRSRAKIATAVRRYWDSPEGEARKIEQREFMRELNAAYAAWARAQDDR